MAIIFRGKKYKSIRQAAISLGLSYRKTWTEYHGLKPNQRLQNKSVSEALKAWR